LNRQFRRSHTVNDQTNQPAEATEPLPANNTTAEPAPNDGLTAEALSEATETTTEPTETPAATPAAAAYPPPTGPAPTMTAAPRKGPRIGMVVWGLILAAIGVWIILGSAGFTIDGQLAVIAMGACIGVVLLVAALISAIRRPDHRA